MLIWNHRQKLITIPAGTTILFTILTVTAFIHVFTFKQHVQDPKFESMTFYSAFFFTVGKWRVYEGNYFGSSASEVA
jgi:hypothetical protein